VKIVAISDTHCRHRSLRLPKGDVLLHAGDLCLKGEKQEVVDFLDWFQRQDYKHKIFIAGNHDFFFEREKRSTIEKTIPKGVTYLHDNGVTIEGIKFWGTPVTPWFFNWAFNRRRGPDIAKHWALVPDDTDVLISHGPPYSILDTVVNETHVGCKDQLKRIMEIKPKLVVCGHVHESYGTTKQNGIKFINACMLNESYELVNKPVVYEVNGE
jgi:Icc-related predicted phosphoesterase